MGKTYRIVFTSEVYVKAETLGEAKTKFEGMPLFTDEAKEGGAEFIDIACVEDGEDYKDLTSEWQNA